MGIDKSCFSYVLTDGLEMLVTLLFIARFLIMSKSWGYMHLTWWWIW
jgi:hypothetical protein